LGDDEGEAGAIERLAGPLNHRSVVVARFEFEADDRQLGVLGADRVDELRRRLELQG